MVADLGSCIDRAVRSLRAMANPNFVDRSIPTTLLRYCEGIAFVTICKGGFLLVGANVGIGCMIARVDDPTSPKGWKWSAPAAVGCGGLGGGFTLGGEKIDSIIILNTRSAVRAFMGEKQITFGGNVSLAIGPVGRDIEAHVGISDNKELIAAYSYSQAKGAYIGGTLEGAILLSRETENRRFYDDQNVSAESILSGHVAPQFKSLALATELNALIHRQGRYSDLAKPVIRKRVSIRRTVAQEPPRRPTKEDEIAGWQTCYTDDGVKYYYNPVTKVSQWERPLPVNQPKREPQPLSTSSYTKSQPIQRQHVPAQPVRTKPKQVAANRALALYDYSALRPDELSFKANSVLDILAKPEPHWWKARMGGRIGLVPANYVRAC